MAAAAAKPAARSAKAPNAKTPNAKTPNAKMPNVKTADSSRPPTAAASRPAAPAKPGATTASRTAAGEPPRNTLVTRARSLPDSDEADSIEPGSLLAGPRNVQPYVLKRGEQYMSKEQLAHFQQILLNWKRDLMEEVDRTVSHMKDEAANFPDPNDRATQEEEFSLELRTRDRERKLIRKIDEALKRIEDGTYGYCLETGEEIGIKRLEARPVATLSIEAQERRERRERQYGDRDDRYR
ncbi:MAG TPA: RNA polymerase-binding protein DksA [Steroidobacteraceae bacterium]|nr:RNA polymerase-binding protein DksA [Steroidobacteraceae bacterium]